MRCDEFMSLKRFTLSTRHALHTVPAHKLPMKKLVVFLILLAGAYFALSKWSPSTLERIAFWKKSAPQIVAAPGLPEPEPAPTPAPLKPGTKPHPGATIAQDGTVTSAASPEPAPATVAVDMTAQVVVLCYHRVEDSKAAGTLNIEPSVFEAHMQRIKDAGLAVISMKDFLAWRRGEKDIPHRAMMITIDDGYVSAFDTARSILKKFGFPWTYFVYTKYIESGGKSITWAQLAQLRDEGVEIGAHTVSHQDLREPRGKSPEAYTQWLRDEILSSKELLEQKLGVRCATFAYPFGGWNSQVLEIVREAGFEASFTVYGQRISHSAPPERIGRYAWNSRRPQDMELAFNFVGPLSASEPPAAAVPSSATPATALLTQPPDGETITDPQPDLKVNLSQIPGIDPASVTLRLSGVGLIPHKLDESTMVLESRPPEPLAPGDYTVTLSGKAGGNRVESQWGFTVAPAKPAGE